MRDSLSPADFESIQALGPEERYDYVIAQLLAGSGVWTLHSDQGTVLMSSDGQDCLPIWPHSEFAVAWVNGDWSDCVPLAIDAAAWQQRWLQGLQADGISLAVFPGQNDEGVVVDPDDMVASLTE